MGFISEFMHLIPLLDLTVRVVSLLLLDLAFLRI